MQKRERLRDPKDRLLKAIQMKAKTKSKEGERGGSPGQVVMGGDS